MTPGISYRLGTIAIIHSCIELHTTLTYIELYTTYTQYYDPFYGGAARAGQYTCMHKQREEQL